MARGRMITNEIARDKRINDLSDDTSRLAYTWLITFADAEGRTYGDPALVRSMLFPRRTDVTIERMEEIIREWHQSGLVLWYECQGDQYISFPAFDRHQIGLRKDREAPSVIPPPPDNPAPVVRHNSEVTDAITPEIVRSNDGDSQEKIGLIKLKLIKENHINQPSTENTDKTSGASAAREGLTEGQKYLLQSLNAKRYANRIQAGMVLELEQKYGTDKLKEASRWAATSGMNLGRAVQAIKSALPKWGQSKSSPGGNHKYSEVYE